MKTATWLWAAALTAATLLSSCGEEAKKTSRENERNARAIGNRYEGGAPQADAPEDDDMPQLNVDVGTHERIAYFHHFFKRYGTGDGSSVWNGLAYTEEYLSQFTPRAIGSLRKAYGAGSLGNEGLAVWLFRPSGDTGERCEVVSVTALDDEWLRVVVRDTQTNRRERYKVRVVATDAGYKIDDVQNKNYD